MIVDYISEELNVVCGIVRGGIDKLPDIYWIFVKKKIWDYQG